MAERSREEIEARVLNGTTTRADVEWLVESLEVAALEREQLRLALAALLEHAERIQEHVPKSENWYAVRDCARNALEGRGVESAPTWSPWRDLEVGPGWYVPAGFPPPQCRRDGDGRVQLRGVCEPQEGTDRRTSPFRLPEDARPDPEWAAAHGWVIGEDGAVTFADGATALLTILP